MENFPLIISLLFNILSIIILSIIYKQFVTLSDELQSLKSNDKRELTHTYKDVLWEVRHVYHNQNGKCKVVKVTRD